MILLIDMICISVSLFLSYKLRFGEWPWQNGESQWIFIIVPLAYLAIGLMLDFYRHFFRRGYLEELKNVLEAEAVVLLVVISLLYLMHRSEELPRLVFGYFLVLNTATMYVMRLLFKLIMIKGYRTSRYSSRLLVVTDAQRAESFVRDISAYNEWYRNVVGIALTDPSDEISFGGVPVVTDAGRLLDYVKQNEVDEVFFADETLLSSRQLNSLVSEFGQMGVVVDVNISEFNIDYSGKKALNRVGKYAVVTFARNIFSNRQLFAKRALDIVGSLFGMVILAVATVFVAPAIKLDSPGPVFFGQTRIGKNGRRFTFYKFRSMYVDAEQRKQELLAQNEVEGPMFKMREDPRITRVGKFLRRTSIDELPQFWNILKGDMSLVGTRPPTVDEFEHYEVKHKCRLSMTPGLTGLWQISGRSDIRNFEDVVELDMEYIDNWNIWKDIKILLLTIGAVVTGKGSR